MVKEQLSVPVRAVAQVRCTTTTKRIRRSRKTNTAPGIQENPGSSEYGKGFFSCKESGGAGWSAPGSLRISGGKFGLLVGGAETDVLMLVMNQTGMQHLLSSKFQMGGEASAAAGPVGRESSAMTDA